MGRVLYPLIMKELSDKQSSDKYSQRRKPVPGYLTPSLYFTELVSHSSTSETNSFRLYLGNSVLGSALKWKWRWFKGLHEIWTWSIALRFAFLSQWCYAHGISILLSFYPLSNIGINMKTEIILVSEGECLFPSWRYFSKFSFDFFSSPANRRPQISTRIKVEIVQQILLLRMLILSSK